MQPLASLATKQIASGRLSGVARGKISTTCFRHEPCSALLEQPKKLCTLELAIKTTQGLLEQFSLAYAHADMTLQHSRTERP